MQDDVRGTYWGKAEKFCFGYFKGNCHMT